MKNTNKKNKTENTFRFKSFADRLNEIDIRSTALYHIGHENEEYPVGDETYFCQAIRKWSVLNLTDEYNQFSKKCQNLITLPQLLHRKEFVVDLLLERLENATTLSLQPILEILVSLGRDLREEFYVHFPAILSKLIRLLNTQDADQLEWTLVCLAFLFKTLKPFLKRNIELVFHSVLPVLSERELPEHISNFAVECFAFVARDIKDFKKIINLVRSGVEEHGKVCASACGRLFFEIIRGVSGSFHSIADSFLECLFDSLLTETSEDSTLFEVIQKTIVDILSFIHPHNISMLWKKICNAIEKSLKLDSEIQDAVVENLIALMHTVVLFKDGKYISESELIVSTVIKAANEIEKESCLLKIDQLACCVLLSSNSKISQLDTSRLIKKILNLNSPKVFEDFLLNICDHPQFDMLILNDFINYFESNIDKGSPEIVATILLKKSPLCRNSITYKEAKKYPIILRKPNTKNKLKEIVKTFKFNGLNDEKFEELLLVALILPHIDLRESAVTKKLEESLLKICRDLQNKDNDEVIIRKSLSVLSLVLESLINLKGIQFQHVTEIVDILLLFAVDERFLTALNSLDLIINYTVENQSKLITKELFDKIHEKLSNNLSSFNQNFRKVTAHTLLLLAENCKDISSHAVTIYKTFFAIEGITPTIHTYREQLLHLHKLAPESETFKNVDLIEVKRDCLKFLLGLLYYNFKLLWDPVLKLLKEYAEVLTATEFWEILKVKLENTADIINGLKPDLTKVYSNINFQSTILSKLAEDEYLNIKVDFDNYRNLLWGTIPNLGSISEVKNREIVTLFLKFVNDEYKKSHENYTLTWNIDSNEEEIDNILQNSKMIAKHDMNFSRRAMATLCVKLQIFTHMVNPKQLYRERELYKFYLELLSNTNSNLQKLALDCLMTYKMKSLVPYKDHLYGLIDEKHFKDELVNFKIDKDSNQIVLEHRSELMPIVLRILYGKMTSKASKNMVNQVKKGLIVRFLAGAERDEIFQFLRMTFEVYEDILSNKLEHIPKVVDNKFSLEKFWSPKVMQGTLSVLELIRKHFGGLLEEDMLVFLLKVLIFVGAACNKLLEKGERINPKVLGVFKNLKSIALISLVNFYDHFQNFNWTEELNNTICDVFVWPSLKKLPQDSIHTPTPLLKLLHIWTQNPKNFHMLAKQDATTKDSTPIGILINLLENEKSKPPIKTCIIEIIDRLINFEPMETDVDFTNLNGIAIISPYISNILNHFRRKLARKRIRRGLDKKDLQILSKLTTLVEDPELCDSLLHLVIPIAVSKIHSATGEEVIAQMLSTISNLIKKVKNPEKYVRKIAPIFEQISGVSLRNLLCDLLFYIAKSSKQSNPHLIETAKLIRELNAWDKRWVEQPDYDKRLNTIFRLKAKLEDNHVDMDLGLLLIYNCFYFLKYDKDMGMRDNSSEFLRLLVPKLVERCADDRKEINFLIDDVLLNLVKRTLRDKNDIVRNEGILLLGEMARECSNAHPVLTDLYSLTDKIDREVDFFENVTHLQSHRHGRALMKFCSTVKTLKAPPNHKTLTQFILPLATKYLLCDKYASKHTLIDSAIESVGVVCGLLPWTHYQAILKYYLQKMRYNHEYQKQLVRIVVSILDAFHFDLRNANGDVPAVKQENVLVIKKDENDESEDEDNIEENEELDDFLEDEVQGRASDVKVEDVYNSTLTLSPSAAKSVVHTIATVLIPTLNHAITSVSNYDSKHKLNRRKRDVEREEEEILRVPIALALVKLLQKLPTKMLDTNLPGVFMKVCTFLKSPLKSVRMLARDILKKIMLTLGSSYLYLLLDQMTSLLTRGFQVHVLSVTVHGVLDCLKEQFQPGEIDSCLQNILTVCLNDIFGEVAAEKEISKIASHTPEAKPSAKSYLTLHIVSRNIQESCLLDLLIPFKQHLSRSSSKKVVTKVQDCFHKIVRGIVENKNISQESLLVFIYGILSQSITDLLCDNDKPQLSDSERKKLIKPKPDCFIIPQEPHSRSGAVVKVVKTNSQTNAHVLIELGLEMLHIVLKRNKIEMSSFESFLNPLIPLLLETLKSAHVRVTTLSLKCLTSIWNSEIVIQSIKDKISEIIEQIFLILHKYSTFATIKKGDNLHLIKNAFKAIVAVLRNCDYYTVTTDHIAQLIFYVEQDLQDIEKQPLAFSLLKSIINRKIDCPEIHEIMRKLCDVSIISEVSGVREEARSIIIIYIMQYPMQKRRDSILKFFTTQLNYSLPTGRLSAIKFLQAIIKKFSEKLLIQKSEFIFLSLGTRLVNEEFPECRIEAASCVEDLISKLPVEQRQKLFDLTLLFLDGEKPAIREMAAVLFSRFITAEKEEFLPRAKVLLPALADRLSTHNPRQPGRFVKANSSADDSHNPLQDEERAALIEQQKQRAIDHELIQILNSIIKILETCPTILQNNGLNAAIDDLAYSSQKLLANDHEWIRLNASKVLYHILGSYDFHSVGQTLLGAKNSDETEKCFIYLNPLSDIRSLTLDLCAQMIPGSTTEQMAEEVSKNLLYIANFLKAVPIELNIKTDEDDQDSAPKINLRWLLRRIRYIAHGEVAKAPLNITLRTAVFNLLEGIIALLEPTEIKEVSPDILNIVVREMSEEDQNIELKLRHHAIRVGNKIRKKIGDEYYNKLRTNLQARLMIKRAERKKVIMQEKINDPVRAAKRKQGVQERKKLAKRRKIDIMRGKIAGKKRKRKLEDEDVF